MGYCYDSHGRLVCDNCGSSGGVRKYKCPFGYCGAPALCEACAALPKEREWRSAAKHRERGCERGHDEYAARQRREAELLASGKAVRYSAKGEGTGPTYKVHVLFRRADRSLEGWYMSEATYKAFPMGDPHVPDDYRRFGELTPAPADFAWVRASS